MTRPQLRTRGRLPRALIRLLGCFVIGTLSGCPSHGSRRPDASTYIHDVVRHERTASIVTARIWTTVLGKPAIMDVLQIELEIGGPPPGFVVVQLCDAAACDYSQRFDDVRLGRQTLEFALIDARGHRPSPGKYRLVVVPYDRDGVRSGGDERPIELRDESA